MMKLNNYYSYAITYALVYSYLLSAAWHESHLLIGCYQAPNFYDFSPHAFSLHQLAPLQGKGISIGLLDSADSLHGKVCADLIRGNTFLKGIAPQATINFAEAFNPHGTAAIKLIQQGLTSLTDSNDLVIINFKIDDSIIYYTKKIEGLERSLKKCPWIIASSGNEGHCKKSESYPASSPSTTLSVGSLGIYNNAIALSSFSEPSLLAAPGQNIAGQGLKNSVASYQGTSLSAMLIGGLVALMLAEFNGTFNQEQLLICMLATTFSLDRSPTDQPTSTFGAVDFRMCLYMLHMLVQLKNNFLGSAQFLQEVLTIRTFLLQTVSNNMQSSTLMFFKAYKLPMCWFNNCMQPGMQKIIHPQHATLHTSLANDSRKYRMHRTELLPDRVLQERIENYLQYHS